eukprot:TRINITY_DN21061_c0_g1_i1.p2 TRINITY_DN21061_c0_g1~~TRINITY_DN21061_c0_g1_i1.p2  ORF type:complete len:184 (+),score=62.77 TRINITY_DN21061_c0_g1_i1:63-614(+)
MGALLSMFGLGGAGGGSKTSILMVGLDAAGKTTILYKLKLDQHVETTPTIGFNLETVHYRNLKLLIRDVGGQDKLRRLWRNYYEGTDAVVFVVDSADTDRMVLAKEELHKLLEEPVLERALVLVYANKQDMPTALSTQQVAQLLDIPAKQQLGYNIHVQGAVATLGEGLFEGLDWLASALRRR